MEVAVFKEEGGFGTRGVKSKISLAGVSQECLIGPQHILFLSTERQRRGKLGVCLGWDEEGICVVESSNKIT
jgi:hypothetical protein